MELFRRIMLSNKGLEYIKDKLRNGKTLSQLVLNSVDLDAGFACTYLPSNIKDQNAFEFDLGGKVPVSKEAELSTKEGKKLLYKGFHGLINTVVSSAQDFFKSNELGLLILEDEFAQPKDDFIKRLENVFVFKNEVYHYLTAIDGQHAGSIKKIINLSGSTFGVMTSSARQFHGKFEAKEDFLNDLVSNVKGLFVEAYDGEGYVLWTKLK